MIFIAIVMYLLGWISAISELFQVAFEPIIQFFGGLF